ncbi:hypothetical protein FCV20_09360 [Clostridium botulinum]|nr:hypothetical protein [Clostridium botulinum F str. Langeland]NFF57808.1 hypothetical protein [Clostridium botulinum]NFL13270.1 hypothetical protein [Clostridium botulinum]NFL16128.1 hypothetical protein [Clostridium botulinum]NFL22683.1 hypothetical protein [Clostridium botulinum]
MGSEGVLLPLKLRKWLSRDIAALYSHFGEDGSIRAGSHRINRVFNKIHLFKFKNIHKMHQY